MRITHSTHRWGLACAFACLALAILAASAPAATVSGPEARGLALERYYESYGKQGQDLRSPDARDAGRPVTTTPAPVAATPALVATSQDGDGIAPLPFVLSLAGAVIVGIGLSTAVHARRRVAA